MAEFGVLKAGRFPLACLGPYIVQGSCGVDEEIYNSHEDPGYAQVGVNGDSLRSFEEGIS